MKPERGVGGDEEVSACGDGGKGEAKVIRCFGVEGGPFIALRSIQGDRLFVPSSMAAGVLEERDYG